ncbi:unnamed protein product, partial [Brassica oleracea]
ELTNLFSFFLLLTFWIKYFLENDNEHKEANQDGQEMATKSSPPQEKDLISEVDNSVFQVLLKISEEEFGLPTEGPITLPFDSVFLEYLIKLISEEEFGLPSGGPITLPFDSVFLEYLIKLIELRMDGDTERALLMSISSARCSLPCTFEQQEQLFVF